MWLNSKWILFTGLLVLALIFNTIFTFCMHLPKPAQRNTDLKIYESIGIMAMILKINCKSKVNAKVKSFENGLQIL